MIEEAMYGTAVFVTWASIIIAAAATGSFLVWLWKTDRRSDAPGGEVGTLHPGQRARADADPGGGTSCFMEGLNMLDNTDTRKTRDISEVIEEAKRILSGESCLLPTREHLKALHDSMVLWRTVARDPKRPQGGEIQGGPPFGGLLQ